MRTVNNDILFDMLLKSEIKNIPYWLRLTKGKLAAASILEICLVGAVVYGVFAHAFTALSGTLYMALLIVAAIAVPLWLVKAHRKGSEAYKTATYRACTNRYRYNKIARSYGDPANLYSTITVGSTNKATYCPNCGLIAVDGSMKCMTCNTLLIK